MIASLWASLAPWGDVQAWRRAPGGLRNEVYFVRIDGRLRVVRFGARSGAELDWEISLLSFLGHEGFSVPCVVPARDGALRIGSTVVFEYVYGAAPATPQDWDDAARVLRRLHDATKGWPQRPSWKATAELTEATVSGVADLGRLPDAAAALCRDAFASIGEPTSVVHGDPNSRNVLVTDDGVALIDWDEARVDDSALDLARLGRASTAARRASAAWEAAACWHIAPRYAAERLSEVACGV